MSEQTTPEPTMEEILASIRRIISEDDAPGAPARALRQADESWEPAEIDAPAADAGQHEEAAQEVEATTAEPAAVEIHGDLDAYVASEPVVEAAVVESAPAPEPALTTSPAPLADLSPAPEPAPAPKEPGLVGEVAATQAASAFDRLSAAAAPPAAHTSPGPALPAAGRTLEDLTRELLTPLIKTWLDDNLAAIVQARVDEEVDRISRGRVR